MRYFIELSYKGTNYAGFQVQDNAATIQSEVEKAMAIVCRRPFALTGSSRTDAGVHARQNFFQFDTDTALSEKALYNINAVLPRDIFIKNIFPVSDDLHCRFHASHRLYKYYIKTVKDVFAQEIAWHYPYTINFGLLQQSAAALMEYEDFTSFSKRNTQTHTKLCKIAISEWSQQGNTLVYTVKANRFLRGMVRALVATQLKLARGKISLSDFHKIIESKDCAKADFSAPAHGLFLEEVGLIAPANGLK